MRLLLDTHAFLWFIWNDPQLSPTARSLIEDPPNALLLSAASAWEIAIKVSTSKLSVGQDVDLFLRDQLTRNRIEILSFTLDHIGRVAQLPFHHKDPFDRMIVSQALTENIPLVSADAVLDGYVIQRLW